MKKFVTALMLMSMMLLTPAAHADMHKKYNGKKMRGSAAQHSTDASLDFAWPVAIGTVAVLVTVAALAASSGTDRTPTFSQN